MRLITLILEDYIRLSNKGGIRFLKWEPGADQQVIMGSNGSGKSSLIREASPLPAEANDYLKTGSKYSVWDHEGHEYICYSTFHPSTKHSFLRDGVEMNAGGTITVQKQLVMQYMGYCEDFHLVLTGQRSFHSMSVGERRKYLTAMCQEDYTYGLAVYERLRVAARDEQGHLKRLKQNIFDETVKLNDGEDVDKLEAEVKAVRDELTELLCARFPVNTPLVQWQRQINDQMKLLEHVSAALNRSVRGIDMQMDTRSANAIEVRLGGVLGRKTVISESLERAKREYADSESLINAIRLAHVDDLEGLESKVLEKRQRAEHLLESIQTFKGLTEIADPSGIFNTTNEVMNHALTAFTQVPDNSARKINKNAVLQAKERKIVFERMIEHHESNAKVLRDRKHAAEHADKVNCPQCKHSWVPGLDPDMIPNIDKAMAELFNQIEQAGKDLSLVNEYLEEVDQYMEAYRGWKGYTLQYPNLNLLWDYIAQHQLDMNRPEENAGIFYTWLDELTVVHTARQLLREVIEEEAILRTAPKGETRLAELRLTSLAANIETLTNQKRELDRSEQFLRQQLSMFKEFEHQERAYNQAIAHLNHLIDEATASLAMELLDQDITRVQTKLGALQHTLQVQSQRASKVQGLTEDLAKSTLDFTALSTMASELSPKAGEIADRMSAFITGWVAVLNSAIKQVWSYDLEVFPCDSSSGDLDYRFPVYMGGANEMPSSDVLNASTSIRQIIDFAFAQTLVRYHNLKHIPLCVDELGANFDPAHLKSLYPYFAQLLESEHYDQLFLINHHRTVWEAMNQAEYVVLNQDNIDMPETYNTHITLM